MGRKAWAATVMAALLAGGGPAAAQNYSPGYKFLEAVRKADGDKVMAALSEPGTTVIDAKDRSSGEGALHIVIKRQDATYLGFLLGKGADPNLRDADGNTPLLLAIQTGFAGAIAPLVRARANVNLANASGATASGETPLIRAVQRRDINLVRELLAANADADQTDRIAGMSARDYAHADARTPAIAKLIDETPKRTRAAVAGPKL